MVDIKYSVLRHHRAAAFRAYWPDGYTRLSGQRCGVIKMPTLSLTRHRKPRKVARRFREAHSLVSEESVVVAESCMSWSPDSWPIAMEAWNSGTLVTASDPESV